MKTIYAAGVLVYRGAPIEEFLLMQHADRLDLPKGHREEGEDDLSCALRELEEETGIQRKDLEIAPDFSWSLSYEVRPKRLKGEVAKKVVTYYLAQLIRPAKIKLTEHLGYQWTEWNPPHRIQTQTIDGLLAAVEDYFSRLSQ